MADNDLTREELATLALFDSTEYPSDVDPLHFAKLLSMALIEQKEGGPELTASGREWLAKGSGARVGGGRSKD